MTNTQLRDQGSDDISARFPYYKKRAMQELHWMRSGWLRLAPQHEALFTFEDLNRRLEQLIGMKIPHPSLAGAITLDACRRGYIEPTGGFKQTLDEQKHARKAFTYRWKLHDTH